MLLWCPWQFYLQSFEDIDNLHVFQTAFRVTTAICRSESIIFPIVAVNSYVLIAIHHTSVEHIALFLAKILPFFVVYKI